MALHLTADSIDAITKKDHPGLYFLWRLGRFRMLMNTQLIFHVGMIESTFTACIMAEFGNSNTQEWNRLRRVIDTVRSIQVLSFPPLKRSIGGTAPNRQPISSRTHSLAELLVNSYHGEEGTQTWKSRPLCSRMTWTSNQQPWFQQPSGSWTLCNTTHRKNDLPWTVGSSYCRPLMNIVHLFESLPYPWCRAGCQPLKICSQQ